MNADRRRWIGQGTARSSRIKSKKKCGVCKGKATGERSQGFVKQAHAPCEALRPDPLADLETGQVMLSLLQSAFPIRALERSCPGPAGMLLRQGVDYAAETLASIRDALAMDRQSVANVLVRALCEVSAKFMWASIAPDGWDRLVVDSVRHELKMAQNAAKSSGRRCESLIAMTKRYSEDAWYQALKAKPLKSIPDMREVLRQISSYDSERGRTSWADLGDFMYFHLYALPSRHCHGRIFCIGKKSDSVPALAVSARWACRFIIDAVRHTGRFVEPMDEFFAGLAKRSSRKRDRKRPL